MKTHALGNFPKPVLRLDLGKLDDLRSEVLGNFSFVKLARNYVTQLGRNYARMGVLFSRDVDSEYIRILNAYVVGLLKMKLYRI